MNIRMRRALADHLEAVVGSAPQSMKSCRFLNASTALTVLLALTACGGGGGTGGPPPGPATVSTLAYVVNECAIDKNGDVTLRQALQIRQGEQMPITVVEHAAGPGIPSSPCFYVGLNRYAHEFGRYGVFHRLGVTPDGSQVVFEVTDDDPQTLFPPNTLPDKDKGIFAVRADGTGLRQLGPASREPPYGVGRSTDFRPFFVFSPNGRMIAYTDRGPSDENADAVQIFTMDLATGHTRQETYLPPAGPTGTYGPLFNDDQHITFFTFADVEHRNPAGEDIAVTVNTIDHTFTIARPPVAIPGSQVLPAFRITSAEVNVADLIQPGTTSKNHPDLPIQELFVIDRDNNILQLTNFQRGDTFNPTLSADGQRVIFVASADYPLGTNPSEDCQIFSIDRSGGDLRRLTSFHEGPSGSRSSNGCLITRPPLGCAANLMSRDTRSGALVFHSTCDPFGSNPYGNQLFAMHEDGTGLRQLTQTRGYTRVSVEAPFPFAYPGMAIVYNFTPDR
jgi:hypothetical protein